MYVRHEDADGGPFFFVYLDDHHWAIQEHESGSHEDDVYVICKDAAPHPGAVRSTWQTVSDNGRFKPDKGVSITVPGEVPAFLDRTLPKGEPNPAWTLEGLKHGKPLSHVTVKSTEFDGWAQYQHVLPGDEVISLNGKDVNKMSFEEFEETLHHRPLKVRLKKGKAQYPEDKHQSKHAGSLESLIAQRKAEDAGVGPTHENKERAAQQVQHVSIHELDELRHVQVPSHNMQRLMEVVHLILDGRHCAVPDLEMAMETFKSEMFAHRIRAHDCAGLIQEPELMTFLLEEYFDGPNKLSLERVSEDGRTAAALYGWAACLLGQNVDLPRPPAPHPHPSPGYDYSGHFHHLDQTQPRASHGFPGGYPGDHAYHPPTPHHPTHATMHHPDHHGAHAPHGWSKGKGKGHVPGIPGHPGGKGHESRTEFIGRAGPDVVKNAAWGAAQAWGVHDKAAQPIAAGKLVKMKKSVEIGGRLYVGFWNERGQRDGYGVLRGADGAVYAGQWEHDERWGRGVLYWDGGIFEGDWKKGHANGPGVVHFDNGDTFSGLYLEDRKHGRGIYRWANGATEEGEYVAGLREGRHVWKHADEIWSIAYKNGVVVRALRSDVDEAAMPEATEGHPLKPNSGVTMEQPDEKLQQRVLLKGANAVASGKAKAKKGAGKGAVGEESGAEDADEAKGKAGAKAKAGAKRGAVLSKSKARAKG